MDTEIAVRMTNITKMFGDVCANKDVCLDIRKGEILSLLGENGSGKTTLMNMLSGIYFPDSGSIEVNGVPVVIKSPKDAFDLHIGMIHQHFKLIDVFTAAENVLLGLKGKLRDVKQGIEAICKKYGAVFIIGIGGKLSDGKKHDGRAPDYDDWSTVAENGLEGLNGDILIWYPVLGRSFELSSMGIRVDEEALLRQLKLTGKEDRIQLYFHKRLLEGSLPLTIGGGIGQSRLCMVLLHKAHVGETQSSIWPEEMRRTCKQQGITLI